MLHAVSTSGEKVRVPRSSAPKAAQLVGDGHPRVTGHITYRSLIPTEQMSGWEVFNLVVTYHNRAPEPAAGKPIFCAARRALALSVLLVINGRAAAPLLRRLVAVVTETLQFAEQKVIEIAAMTFQ
jgi:hypothetical protein